MLFPECPLSVSQAKRLIRGYDPAASQEDFIQRFDESLSAVNAASYMRLLRFVIKNDLNPLQAKAAEKCLIEGVPCPEAARQLGVSARCVQKSKALAIKKMRIYIDALRVFFTDENSRRGGTDVLSLRALRKENLMPLSECARALGAKEATVYRYESGKSVPGAKALRRYSRLFNAEINLNVKNGRVTVTAKCRKGPGDIA